jgi:D-glycero-beta-D-manno-heptose-7-phosphate kinase
MVKLASTLSRLNSVKVLVVGDFLLDTYTIGKARRISPEAPVAIVHVQQEEHRPGGSGNVVLNLLSLGAEVVPLGRVGNDWAGQVLVEALEKEGVNTNALIVQERYQTPVKNRIIAENQQIVRVDREQTAALLEYLEQQIIESLPSLLQEIKVVAISDYGKGFLTPTLLGELIAMARAQGCIIIVDPKGSDFQKYKGVTYIKPNLSEAYLAAGLPSHAALENVAKKILETTQADRLMITRSEAGISLFDFNGQRFDFPVHIREVKDVTGAGDTVLAMLTYALANGLSDAEAAHLCNIAAGIAIEHIGCARVTLSDLAQRLLERDINNKIFDEEHLYALREVLRHRSVVLLGVSSEEGFNPSFFKAIKSLSKADSHLLIYLTDANPDEIFVETLASLKEVDFLLVGTENLRLLCQMIHPKESYCFKDSQLLSTKGVFTNLS